MQKDLETLFKNYPQGVQLVLRFEDDLYHVFIKVQGRLGEPNRLHTQRKDPKTFTDIGRALSWGERQGFSSVLFYHEWNFA